jgi:hypothetical protein
VSHRTAWLCKGCRYQLGELVGGALRIWVPAPLVGAEMTTAECPRCLQINIWRRVVQTSRS